MKFGVKMSLILIEIANTASVASFQMFSHSLLNLTLLKIGK